eukprot:2188847-Amphidinium_carterae.1
MSQSLTNAACGLRVVDIETPQCLIQEHGSFKITDLPVVEWKSSTTTTHSMYVVVINKLDHEASVPDLAVALEEGIAFHNPLLWPGLSLPMTCMTANTVYRR